MDRNGTALVFCTAPMGRVTAWARLNARGGEVFAVPFLAALAGELSGMGHRVETGLWEGLFEPGKIGEEALARLKAAGADRAVIICNNQLAHGYGELAGWCLSELGVGEVELSLDDSLSITLDAGMAGDADGFIQKLLAGLKTYPAHYGLDPDWDFFGPIFETTFLCNFDCVHCPRKVADLDRTESISAGDFLKFTSSPRIRHATLLGLGESLMNPGFPEIAGRLAEMNVPVSIITNGSLLTPERLGPLAGPNLTVVVSLDDLDDDTFGLLRKKDGLARIKENIRRLVHERPEVKIAVNSVISKDNYTHLEGMVEGARKLGVREVNFLNVLALEEETDASHGMLLPEKERLAHIERAKTAAKELGVTLGGYIDKPRRRACMAPWQQPYVALNGDVYPCCFIYRIPGETFDEYFLGRIKTVPLGAYRLGNLHRDSLEELWVGEKARKIRGVLLDSQDQLEMPIERFQELREGESLENPYDYCRICLFRWGCAC